MVGEMLRHLETFVATWIATLVKPYGEVTFEMLPKLGVFVESLAASVDWAIEILAIIQNVLSKTDKVLLKKIIFILWKVNCANLLPALFWLQVEEGLVGVDFEFDHEYLSIHAVIDLEVSQSRLNLVRGHRYDVEAKILLFLFNVRLLFLNLIEKNALDLVSPQVLEEQIVVFDDWLVQSITLYEWEVFLVLFELFLDALITVVGRQRDLNQPICP